MPPSTVAHDNAIAALIDAIAARGYVVAPDFVDHSTAVALRARALALDATGGFSPAAVGRGSGRVERTDIRGDRIAWLAAAADDHAERGLLTTLEALRLAANRSLQLGLFEFEGHYAIYPAGRGYALHRDRFRDDDARVLSIVLYLNERWRADEGGSLRLHLPDGGTPVDIAPEAGTLAVFLSDRFPHEVMPATRDRLSIAGWFRRRSGSSSILTRRDGGRFERC